MTCARGTRGSGAWAPAGVAVAQQSATTSGRRKDRGGMLDVSLRKESLVEPRARLHPGSLDTWDWSVQWCDAVEDAPGDVLRGAVRAV
jgi:hypothetical protein